MHKLIISMLIGITCASLAACSNTNQNGAESSETSKKKTIAIDEEHFPDEAFRSFVKDTVDTNGDDVLSSKEIKSATDFYFCGYLADTGYNKCCSLEGIQYFTELQSLQLIGLHGITEFDLSLNPKLTMAYFLDCGFNSLDVSKSSLRILNIHDECLETLILDNPELQQFTCSYCPIKELDLSKCPSLEEFTCDNMDLTSIDLSHNQELCRLECESLPQITAFDFSNNGHLYYVKLTDLSNVETLDFSHNSELRYLTVNNLGVTELDLSKNPIMEGLYCHESSITKVDIRNCSILKNLIVNDCKLDSVNGQIWDSDTLGGGQMFVPFDCEITY